MSEPCHTLSDRKSPPPRPASVTLSPLKTPVDIHPNQAVILDEVGEEEMVENKLVIPDEMVHYLNQVADTQNGDFNSLQWSENTHPTTAEQKQISGANQMIGSPSSQMLLSPNPILPSSTQNFSHVLPSPQNANVLSPSTVNQIMPSPGSMNQVLPSPSSNMNQVMQSPASNINQMLPSPGPKVNQMMPSPVSNVQMVQSPSANINQMMPSPASNFNQMVGSPNSYTNAQNPLLSPAPIINQMMPSPQNNMTMVQSPMSIRCQSQLMSPDTTSMNQNMMMMPSGSHPVQNSMQPSGQIMQNSQNCGVPSQNQMMQNGHINMNQNQCYNSRSVNHNMCYMQHGDNTWNNNMQMQQRNMCQTDVQQNNHITMCHSRSTNIDYNNQCRQQVQSSNNSFINSRITPQNSCNNHHNYQMCSTNNFVNTGCHTNKHINNYTCNTNTYSSMQPAGYSCVPNINEPLTSPAMAAPAPSDTITQPQQAQMSRPCAHYGQNCYRYNNQCTPNQNTICNCIKVNMYPQQTTNNKCYHQCTTNSEIQCKDVSQSQISPGVVNPMNTNVTTKNSNNTNANNTQPYGMRQDAYQRTLEYVQNCQSWVSSSEMFNNTNSSVVKCADTLNSNMVVNDMTSSLSSLLEENRYLEMIQ